MNLEAIRVCDALHASPVAPSTREIEAVRAVGAIPVALRSIRSSHRLKSQAEWQSHFAY